MRGDTFYWLIYWWFAEKLSKKFGVTLSPRIRARYRSQAEKILNRLREVLEGEEITRTLEEAVRDHSPLLESKLPDLISAMAIKVAVEEVKKGVIQSIDFAQLSQALLDAFDRAEEEELRARIRGLVN